MPFTLRGGNRYADTVDITGIAQWDLPDLVWALGFVPNVTIDSVTGASTVTDDPSVFASCCARARLAGAWVKLDKETPARVKAGKRLRLRVVLGNQGGNEIVPLVYRIPAKAAGQRGRLFLNPGFPFPLSRATCRRRSPG